MEARVPDKIKPRFSDGWTDQHKSIFTNLPGRRHHDDIAQGDKKYGPFQPKQDYPDFAIVADNEKELRYRRLYFTRFRTGQGDSNSETAGIQYTVQASRRARDFGEKVYCNSRKRAYQSCMFLAGPTACYREARIGDPLTRTVINWRTVTGTARTVTKTWYGC
jgi:hypothetical protein